jgi:hypothetical protein
MSQTDEATPLDPASVPTDPIARAAWYGIDLTLLKENLRRTPTERLENHRRALEAVEEIRKATRERRIRATAANPAHRQG